MSERPVHARKRRTKAGSYPNRPFVGINHGSLVFPPGKRYLKTTYQAALPLQSIVLQGVRFPEMVSKGRARITRRKTVRHLSKGRDEPPVHFSCRLLAHSRRVRAPRMSALGVE